MGRFFWGHGSLQKKRLIDPTVSSEGVQMSSPESDGKGFNLPVLLCSNPHLCSWASDSEQRNEIADSWLKIVCPVGCLDSVLGMRMRSSDIQGELRLEPLLLRLRRTRLKWFKQLIRMSPGCLSVEVFLARPTRRRPWGIILYISSGLGTPWDTRRSWKVFCGGEDHLEYPA